MAASLTLYEMQLVENPQVLLSKNKIIKDVYTLFAELAEEYRKVVDKSIINYPDSMNAKISRGENYKGLPYVMLDFPREFSKKDVFAIRTLFWWGNFFSITLHLSGKYYQQFYVAIQNAVDENSFKDWYISASQNQWEHHFESDNYKLIEEEKYNIDKLPFLKIAKKIPLQKWDEANVFFIENFTLIIKTLEGYAPIL